MDMKGKPYTMLKVKSEYGLTSIEKMLYWMIGDTSLEEYIRSLIDLRDAGHIYEDNDGNPITYRNHYLTEKGYAYLPKVKRLYLKELWLKNRWTLIGWTIMFVLALLAVI